MLCGKFFGFVKRHATVPSVVIVFAFTYLVVLDIKTGETISSWVQALGSIGAIFAATYIAREDRRAELEREKAKVRVICRALEFKLVNAQYAVQVLNDTFFNVGTFGDEDGRAREKVIPMQVRQVNESLLELRAFDLIQLPTPEAVNALVGTIGTLEAVIFQAQRSDVDNMIESGGDEGPLFEHIVAVHRYLKVIHQIDLLGA